MAYRIVSIRASLQQRGERPKKVNEVEQGAFQSAPHFSSEANLSSHCLTFRSEEFQSAPHFSSEANAPLRIERFTTNAFQSAPHFSSEANAHWARRRFEVGRFNPRLTSAARRTACVVNEWARE